MSEVRREVPFRYLCKCLPIEPDLADYRHLAKHVPIPDVPIQVVTVTTILVWAQDPLIPPDAPRSGRELEVFHRGIMVPHVLGQMDSLVILQE